MDPTYRYELAIPLIHLKSFFDGNEIKFNILLRGFREIRPSQQDIALAEQMEVSMQDKLMQVMKNKTPNVPTEVINRNLANIKDDGRWTEFSGSYRLAVNSEF
ncbi:hypothetical protein [Sphingobacterium paucimobilis]|uniref:Uncharacterized protein n=1 Tax=Sphingobacterium paucimobilis HER1398 TaxID=1346330 RepID=U2HXZ6_9SPHI|nr:hypothetical protein [Sphingobacterium paucimobilis]ERJ60135.1 hypothetical protein M472_15325 [Sphingobacterium paucimobilis HER1398]